MPEGGINIIGSGGRPPRPAPSKINEDSFEVALQKPLRDFWSELQLRPVVGEAGLANLNSPEAEELRRNIFTPAAQDPDNPAAPAAPAEGLLIDEGAQLKGFIDKNANDQRALRRRNEVIGAFKGYETDANAAFALLKTNYNEDARDLLVAQQQQRLDLEQLFRGPDGQFIVFNDNQVPPQPIPGEDGHPLKTENIYQNALRLLEEKQAEQKQVLVDLYNHRQEGLMARFGKREGIAVALEAENRQRQLLHQQSGSLRRPSGALESLGMEERDPAGLSFAGQRDFKHQWYSTDDKSRKNFFGSKGKYGEMVTTKTPDPKDKSKSTTEYKFNLAPGMKDKDIKEASIKMIPAMVANSQREEHTQYDLSEFAKYGIAHLKKMYEAILIRHPGAKVKINGVDLDTDAEFNQIRAGIRPKQEAWRRAMGLNPEKQELTAPAAFTLEDPVLQNPANMRGGARPILPNPPPNQQQIELEQQRERDRLAAQQQLEAQQLQAQREQQVLREQLEAQQQQAQLQQQELQQARLQQQALHQQVQNLQQQLLNQPQQRDQEIAERLQQLQQREREVDQQLRRFQDPEQQRDQEIVERIQQLQEQEQQIDEQLQLLQEREQQRQELAGAPNQPLEQQQQVEEQQLRERQALEMEQIRTQQEQQHQQQMIQMQQQQMTEPLEQQDQHMPQQLQLSQQLRQQHEQAQQVLQHQHLEQQQAQKLQHLEQRLEQLRAPQPQPPAPLPVQQQAQGNQQPPQPTPIPVKQKPQGNQQPPASPLKITVVNKGRSLDSNPSSGPDSDPHSNPGSTPSFRRQ